MNPALFPLLEVALVLPWVGAATIAVFRNPNAAARLSLSILIVVLAVVGLLAFPWSTAIAPGGGMFALDAVSAPMLPVLVLLHLLTLLGTAKSRLSASRCIRILLGTFVGLAVVTCRDAWVLIAILSVATLIPFWDLTEAGRPTRGFTIYMAAFIALLGIGQLLIGTSASTLGFTLILVGIGIRGGIFPGHGWVPRLFRHASYATAILFVLPLMEVAAAIRLLLPTAPAGLTHFGAVACLVTAIYGGGMAIVQSDVRRFYAHLCLSQTSLVLFDVLAHNAHGLTAALCLWISASLSLAGLAFSVRALESRFGPLSLDQHHGHYAQVPGLAVTFLITGLACVGFPGTIGFIPMELLFAGSVDAGLWISACLAFAAGLNGIAILRAYFALFTGRRPTGAVSLPVTPRERVGIVIIAVIVFAGCWLPPEIVASRHHAAEAILGSPAAPSLPQRQHR